MDLGKVSKITRGGYAKAQDDVQNYAPLPKLKIGSWEHLEQIPTVMMTFVHIRNISALTDSILLKLQR